LHEVFLSIPSARYTDKAAGPTEAKRFGPENKRRKAAQHEPVAQRSQSVN